MGKISSLGRRLLGAFCIVTAGWACAENPIIQTNFNADPAPLVANGKVYLYTGQDEDDAHSFKMLNWRLYTSTDLVNWTDKGVVANLATFRWAVQDNGAWAAQVVQRDGKYYLYVTITSALTSKRSIGVAVSDTPEGPFKDAIGKPLIDGPDGFIDPTVFVDDDGQAYMYWGNPHLWYAKLGQDMVSLASPITKVDSKPANYQEGPWLYKRQGHYYLAYASTCCPEGIGYAMSKSPTGPWEYKGDIMDHNPASTGNHPGIIEYKGKPYVFGFNYRLNFADTPIHRERRSITLAKLEYRPDGTIPMLPWWEPAGVEQVGTLSPYGRVEAETIAWTSRVKRDRDREIDWAPGIKTAKSDKVGMYITRVTDRTYIKVAGVDFGSRGASTFSAQVASAAKGGKIELRLDKVDGPVIGTLPVSNTGGWDAWRLETAKVSGAQGVHDLYLIFRGGGYDPLFNVDYWSFQQ
jgi:hypothetical protein